MSRLAPLFSWLTLGAAISCGSSTAPASNPAIALVDAGPFMYQTCDLAARVGNFKIALDSTFTAVSGTIASAVDPLEVPQVIQQAGDCRLLGRHNPFCDPACGPEMRCGDGGKCLAAPVPRSAGTVSIAGLSAPVRMTPAGSTLRYDYLKLPHPGFAAGAAIQLRAAGADVGPFLLQGWGITAVDLLTEGTVLDHGKDLVLHWTAGPPGPARIFLELQIDQHGTTRATLACDVPDNGTATMSADLIDALVALGATGFPSIRISRRTVDAATLASGCVELQVLSAAERSLMVPGHYPCKRDADCPAGKTCDGMLETCR
jgi:hypothetical protein